MMTRGLILTALLIGLMINMQPSGYAAQMCAPDFDPYRLKLGTPFGCATEFNFKRQINNPRDLEKPRTESPPDTARRIKALSDWRTSKPQQSLAPDSPTTESQK